MNEERLKWLKDTHTYENEFSRADCDVCFLLNHIWWLERSLENAEYAMGESFDAGYELDHG